MRSVVAFAALLTIVRLSSPQRLDPESVPKSQRSYWCQQQETQCPLICTQETESQSAGTLANDCDADTLVYDCVCDNGLSPNISEYSQTVPYFICTESNNQCVDDCNGNTACQTSCREDNPCGAQNPTRVNVTSTISLPSSTTSGTRSTGTNNDDPETTDEPSTFGDDNDNGNNDDNSEDSNDDNQEESNPDEPDAASILNLGQSYGLAIILTSFFAGFAVL
ncbi:hypothetical protein M501DRAFT_1008462 [Patellaria atrata CBS 101060]|uniref:DUF7707 domain-containing protein n=1 Tax=Patellaria atrata CBS 101060 TaxID=1346257 RepID=A0A9P4S576_9PEZI|nr:hypothetical protein M501DRAFT_1008462 [Patellaria atrata CBS 101060]